MICGSDPVIGGERAGAPGRIRLFEMPFDAVDFAETVDCLVAMAQGDRPTYAVTANVDHVVRFRSSPEIRDIYARADLVVADGMPVIWASRLLGASLPERVAGSDLLPALCARAARQDLSVYLLGGTPGTARDGVGHADGEEAACETPCRRRCSARCAARRAASILKRRYPRLRVAGTYCPDYGFEHDRVKTSRVVSAIRATRPEILFVGLGSPKQEQWIVSNAAGCGAKLSIGIGISFSFLCGDVARAPHWMQRAGLEWFHRLCQEPGRLWKRYLVTDMAFLMLVAGQFLRRCRGNRGRSVNR